MIAMQCSQFSVTTEVRQQFLNGIFKGTLRNFRYRIESDVSQSLFSTDTLHTCVITS